MTGKTPSGWSIGLIEAVTSRERARVITGGIASATDVEPLSNYMVARLLREVNRGGAGFLVTSTNRRLDTPLMESSMLGRSIVAGGDGYYYFDRNKEWVVTGKLSGSLVSGSEAAIAGLQRAPQRYYQRPDAPQVSFDPTRTSLAGYAGRVNVNRNSGIWRVNASLWGVSPGFDSNDLGFHGIGDRAGGHSVLLYLDETQNQWSRFRMVWLAKAWTWNFNRRLTTDLWFGCAATRFLNYWGLDGCGSVSRGVGDDQLTRGGPSAINPASGSVSLGAHSDDRKWISFGVNGRREWNRYGGWSANIGLGVTVKPSSSLTMTLGPDVSRSNDLARCTSTRKPISRPWRRSASATCSGN